MKSGDWCLNDKAYKSYDLSQELQVYDYSTHMFYDSNVRLGSASTLQPTLKCRGTQMKKFKNVIVDGVHITAEIDMYVATLTADEIVFAGESLIYGNGQQTFLTALDSFEYDVHNYSTNSIGFWTLSPWYFRVGGIDDSGDSVLTISNYPYPQISKFLVSEDCGFRPAIVLKKGNVLDENVSGQNGTREHPYVIG